MSEQLVTPENVTTKDGKINLLDLNRQQMREFFKDLGEKPFRADQVMKWMYHYCCDNFDEDDRINKSVARQTERGGGNPCTGSG